jgi:hypothetical protein
MWGYETMSRGENVGGYYPHIYADADVYSKN